VNTSVISSSQVTSIPCERSVCSSQDFVIAVPSFRSTSVGKYLKVLNRTCSAGTANRGAYGDTAGPILRSAVPGEWGKFILRVVGHSPEGDTLVTMETFYPSNKGTPL